MQTYYLYDLDTGLFTGASFSGPEHDQAFRQLNTPPGKGAWPGQVSPTAQRVVNGQLVAWQRPKPADTEHITHLWSDAQADWVPVPTFAGQRAAVIAAIKARIAQAEGTTDRWLRAQVLAQPADPAHARMQAIEDEVAPLRALLAQTQAALTPSELPSLGD